MVAGGVVAAMVQELGLLPGDDWGAGFVVLAGLVALPSMTLGYLDRWVAYRQEMDRWLIARIRFLEWERACDERERFPTVTPDGSRPRGVLWWRAQQRRQQRPRPDGGDGEP